MSKTQHTTPRKPRGNVHQPRVIKAPQGSGRTTAREHAVVAFCIISFGVLLGFMFSLLDWSGTIFGSYGL